MKTATLVACLRTILTVLVLTLFASSGYAQVAVTNPGNTTPALAATYTSLANAITALNATTAISGPVTITLTGNETAPAGGYSITAIPTGASATNNIVIQGSGSTITAPTPQASGNLNDAIFKLIGADFITIQNFTMLENAANTTTAAGTNNMTEWGVALLYATTTNGAQNNTIQNNTITLNRTYQNTFGIYSNSTHSATAVTTSATATTAAGGNSGLKVYGNAISNVNNGVVVVGPTAAADANTGIDIGGAGGGQANSVTNFGTTGTFSGYANVSGTVNGILVRNSNGLNVSFNTVTSSVGGTTAGTLNGIQIPAASNTPTGTFTNNINSNIISLQSAVATGAINGINSPSGSASTTSVLNVNSNDFNTFGHTVAASGSITFITNASTHLTQSISNNTFTNLTVNTTGSVTFINNTNTAPAGGTKNVNGNSIVTAFNRTGTSGAVIFFSDNGSDPGASNTNNFNNNSISNVTLAGTSSFTGISSTNGGAPTKNVNNNTVSNVSGASGALIGIATSFDAGPTTVSGNTVSSMTGGGAVTGLTHGSGAGTRTISKNKIYDLNGTGAASVVIGLGITSTTSSSAITVVNNLIGNLTAANATSANGIRGIEITGSATTSTFNVYYNTVYLNNPTSGAGFGSSGISVLASSTATTSTLDLRNNVIVNRSVQNGAGLTVAYRRSSGTTGTLANYATTSNNNDFYAGTPSVANLIYSDGTSSAQSLAAYKAGVFTAGTIAPRDSASISENPTFLSTVGSNANFLHIDTTVGTQIESAGAAIAGITDDFDGNSRNVSTPDIGADEFNGIGIDLTPPTITYTALANTTSTSARTLTATIADASGVPTAGAGLPVLYWKINSGSYSSATATSLGSDQYQFTFGSGVVGGDIVSYYVVAQDSSGSPNVASQPAGASGFSINPPAASSPPGSPSTYTVLATLAGSFNVGTGQTYPTLTAAITALNNSVITGPVTFTLTSATYLAETLPIIMNANSGSSAINTVTIKPAAGVSPTISGSSASCVITLNGADYVTIDGSNTVGGTSRDLTIINLNSATATADVCMLSAGVGAGATNNVVKNLNLVGTSVTSTDGTLAGVFSGSATISNASTGADNDNNTIQNNSITKTVYGIYSGGASAANKNTGTIITQNVMNAASPNNITTGGILAKFEDGIQITQNDISVLKNDGTTGTTGTAFGIALGLVPSNTVTTFTGSDVVNALVSRNKINGVTQMNSTGYSAFGIVVNSVTSGTTQVANNTISGVRSAATASDFSAGIVAGGGTGSATQVYFNSVSMTGTRGAATYPSYCLAIANGDPVVDVRNNVFFNTQSSTNTGKMYAIGTGGTTFANLTSNYNDLYVLNVPNSYVGQTGGLGIAGTDRFALASWIAATGKDTPNSISSDPLFNSTTNLQPQVGSPVVDAGTSLTAQVSPYVDFSGAPRVDPPSMGAYESGSDSIVPSITYTALANTISTSNRTLTAAITDATGVPTSGSGLPVIYFRKGTSGSFASTQGVFVSGSNYDFTIDYALVSGGSVAAGDTIQYYVVAQDTATIPNVTSNPLAGAGGFTSSPPAAGTPPTTPSSYSIVPTLTGTFSVGAGGNYPTLTAAIAALNNSVITRPVVFELTDATYGAGETFPLTINANPGSSATNTITIRPASGVSPTVTGSGGALAVIMLNGADFVRIDGSNNGSTSQDLTLISGNNGGVVVWVASASSSDGANSNTIKNIKMSGTAGTTGTIAGVMASSGSSFLSGADSPNSNNTIQNILVTKCQNGVFISGKDPGQDQNWAVVGNTFGSTVALDKLGFRGVFIGNAQNFVVTDNTIKGVVSSGTSTSTMSGIQVAFTVNGGTIARNRISDIKQTNTSGWGSNGIYLGTGSTASNVTVVNNFIWDVASYGFNGVGVADNGYGIMVYTGAGFKIYDNTVSLATNQTSSSGITAAINVSEFISTVGGIDLRGNILSNTQTVGTRYAIYVKSPAGATAFSNINYNDYVGQNVGFLTSARATLADWQTATGQDAASLSVDPLLVSATDLHLQSSSPMLGMGVALATVTDDIDGELRETPPDIGADEIACTGPAIAVNGQPANAATCAGTGNVAFHVVASGSGPLSYQWRRNAVSLSNTGVFSGVDTADLTIVNTGSSGDEAGSYDCIVSNACGSVTSNIATLTVNLTPQITSGPNSVSVCQGSMATFHITISNTATGYQWRRGTTPLVNDSHVSGANTDTLVIDPVALADAGDGFSGTGYNCVVTNACGNSVSSNANLAVTPATTYYLDGDHDGYGVDVPATNLFSCTNPGVGYATQAGDCDDTRDYVHPFAPELCDGIDNDCDTAVDEGVLSTFYADADGDTYGNPNVHQDACAAPVGYVSNSGDCDDSNIAINPGATEVCDGVDNNCAGGIDEGVLTNFYLDGDHDGHGSATATAVSACIAPPNHVTSNDDCDDGDAAVFPGNPEVCDGKDNDCSNGVDDGLPLSTFYHDGDGDGYGSDSDTQQRCGPGGGYVALGGDCDDNNIAINPGATEVCDGVDNNCAGGIDEGITQTTYYLDLDNDSYGSASSGTVSTCQPAPSGYVAQDGDCDDTNAAIHPGASEVCNGHDDDCDGLSDDDDADLVGGFTFYVDADSDGYGTSVSRQFCTSGAHAGYASVGGDCNDGDASISPGDPEVCDGGNVDEDCDGLANDNDPSLTGGITFYVDSDGDGYGSSVTRQFCTSGAHAGYASVSGDCNDGNAGINPGAAEVCDASNLDEDCDGLVNDNDPSLTGGITYFQDNDGDGYGSAVTRQFCASGAHAGYASVGGDCDDTRSTVYPGATEICDGLDNDCNSVIDDGAPGEIATWLGTLGGNWSDASKWSTGRVPNSCTDVRLNLFPATVIMDMDVSVRSLEIGHNGTGPGGTGAVYLLSIQNGRSLTVATSTLIEVTGQLRTEPCPGGTCTTPALLLGGPITNKGLMQLVDCTATCPIETRGVLESFSCRVSLASVAVTSTGRFTVRPSLTCQNGECAVASLTNVGINEVLPFAHLHVTGAMTVGSNTLPGGGTLSVHESGRVTSAQFATMIDSSVHFTDDALATGPAMIVAPELRLDGDLSVDVSAIAEIGGNLLCGTTSHFRTFPNSALTVTGGTLELYDESLVSVDGPSTLTISDGSLHMHDDSSLRIGGGSRVYIFGGVTTLDGTGYIHRLDDGITTPAELRSSVDVSSVAVSAPFVIQRHDLDSKLTFTTSSLTVNGGSLTLDLSRALGATLPSTMSVTGDVDLSGGGMLVRSTGASVSTVTYGGDVLVHGGDLEMRAADASIMEVSVAGAMDITKVSAITARFGKCVATDSGDFKYRMLPGSTLTGEGTLSFDRAATATMSCALEGDFSPASDGVPGTLHVAAPGSTVTIDVGTPLFQTGIYRCDMSDGGAHDEIEFDGACAIVPRSVLKEYFQVGDLPTQPQRVMHATGGATFALGEEFSSVLVDGHPECTGEATYSSTAIFARSGAVLYYTDADGDTYGDASSTPVASCLAVPGSVTNAGDCDDHNAAVHPGATETCNGIDDDCDGGVDEGLTFLTYYRDADSDNFGNPAISQSSCQPISGWVLNSLDCNDSNGSIYPGAIEVCDSGNVDEDCDGLADDLDPSTAMASKTTWYRDADGDGHGNLAISLLRCDQPSGFVLSSDDCDDAHATVNPGASEICDGLDNDCDGSVDEGLSTVTYYRDADGDTYGNPGMTQVSCSGSAPSGFVTDNTDCNDSNAAIHPNATEVCNGIDDDCDGTPDDGLTLNTYYADADGDGYGSTSVSQQACSPPSGYVSTGGDCNDSNPAVHPGVSESCNGIDDNCNGVVDEGFATTNYFVDADHDGYGALGSPPIVTCQTLGFGYSTNNLDCDDNQILTFPGAPEICNGVDDNCNGVIDDGVTNTYYADPDGDLFGSPSGPTTQACTPPPGYVANNTDNCPLVANPDQADSDNDGIGDACDSNGGDVVLTVQLQGVTDTLQRCLHLEFADSTAAHQPLEVDVSPTFNGGQATFTVPGVTCGDYDCVRIRDPKHTLASVAQIVSSSSGCTVAFSGADALVGGNLNNDMYIDILDFGQFVGAFGTSPGASTPCGLTTPNADISGNGNVDGGDFTYININFLRVSDPACGTNPRLAAPRSSITVPELFEMGLGQLVVADLNSDGVLDAMDVSMYFGGAMPGEVAVFTGAEGGRWSDPANWSGGFVPMASTDVVVTGRVVVDAPDAVARQVLVIPNAMLSMLSAANGQQQAGALACEFLRVFDGGELELSGDACAIDARDVVFDGQQPLNWNSGVINLRDGTLVAPDAQVSVRGTLQGLGVVDADIECVGSIIPFGKMTITGDLTMTADGTVQCELRDGEGDLLEVGGVALLGGTLNVTLPDGFVPHIGQRWLVMHAGVLQGAFDRVNLPNVPGVNLTLQMSGGGVAIICQPASSAP